MRFGLLAVLVGCGSATAITKSTPPTPTDEVPRVRFLVMHKGSYEFATTSAKGLEIGPNQPLPSRWKEVRWVGDEPIVQLQGGEFDYEMSSDRPLPKVDQDAKDVEALNGRVGHITANGFELYPAIPDDKWPHDKPGEETPEHFERPWWDLVVTPANEVWQGRCEWGHGYDGGACTSWSWARLDVPGAIVAKEPLAAHEPEARSVAPSKRVTLSWVKSPDHDDALVMHCTGAGSKTEYPPDEEVEGGMADKVRWISTEPPIFEATHLRFGMTGYDEPVIFEGCDKSEKWADAQLIGGREDLVALVTRDLVSIRFRGKEIGTLPTARQIRFSPK